jgi:ferredoxin
MGLTRRNERCVCCWQGCWVVMAIKCVEASCSASQTQRHTLSQMSRNFAQLRAYSMVATFTPASANMSKLSRHVHAPGASSHLTSSSNCRLRTVATAVQHTRLAQPRRCRVHSQPEGQAQHLMTVHFREEGVTTTAAPGDNLIEVAAAAGVTIPTGCWQGNCGVCEVRAARCLRPLCCRITAAARLGPPAPQRAVHAACGRPHEAWALSRRPSLLPRAACALACMRLLQVEVYK